LCCDMNLRSVVTFTGMRNDVPGLIAQADVLALPSLQEGLPQVVLEAMAAGKPVVSSCLPGIDELIQDGQTGILVPPADSGALAHAIETLATDRELASRMGKCGREVVKSGKFSPGTEADGVRAVIHYVLRRPKQSPGIDLDAAAPN